MVDDTNERNSDCTVDSDYSDSDSTICIECTESYADSIPGEQWIQCIKLQVLCPFQMYKK